MEDTSGSYFKHIPVNFNVLRSLLKEQEYEDSFYRLKRIDDKNWLFEAKREIDLSLPSRRRQITVKKDLYIIYDQPIRYQVSKEQLRKMINEYLEELISEIR